MPDTEEDDAYYCFGDLQLFDARKILPRLEEENIRFQVETDSSGVGRIAPAVAEYGSIVRDQALHSPRRRIEVQKGLRRVHEDLKAAYPVATAQRP